MKNRVCVGLHALLLMLLLFADEWHRLKAENLKKKKKATNCLKSANVMLEENI